jgi:hypothetical protein
VVEWLKEHVEKRDDVYIFFFFFFCPAWSHAQFFFISLSVSRGVVLCWLSAISRLTWVFSFTFKIISFLFLSSIVSRIYCVDDKHFRQNGIIRSESVSSLQMALFSGHGKSWIWFFSFFFPLSGHFSRRRALNQ